ncbi:hypothetical protein BGX38DRAFT_1205004, partial [Terfezia claveryi]
HIMSSHLHQSIPLAVTGFLLHAHVDRLLSHAPSLQGCKFAVIQLHRRYGWPCVRNAEAILWRGCNANPWQVRITRWKAEFGY